VSTSDLTQIGILIVSFLVGLVILFYTRETWKLRQEAQRQNDQAVMPIVMLECATDLPYNEPGANMPSSTTVARNLGRGAAFNIEIESLNGSETVIQFHPLSSLAAGDRQPVMMSIHEEGKLVHSHAYGHIQRMFHNHQLVTHASGIIRYVDVNGKGYRTILTFHYDNFTKEVISKLEKVELDVKR
jgi:hypothetical protein